MGYLQKQTPAQGSVGFTGITTGAISVTGAASVGTTLSVTGATFGPVASLEAFATGGQAGATALTSGAINVVTVCDNAGDSVKLPNVAAGSTTIVRNSGAKCLAVYPATGETIDGLAANAPYYVASGSTQTFGGDTATSWRALNKGLRYVPLDPGAWTVQVGSLTQDNAWHDLDISAAVPPSGRGFPVQFRVDTKDAAAGSYGIFRRNGQTNLYNAAIIRNQVANVVNSAGDCMVPTDSAGVIEYLFSEAMTTIDIVVRGYWVEG